MLMAEAPFTVGAAAVEQNRRRGIGVVLDWRSSRRSSRIWMSGSGGC
jgi:hypothetical protein